MKHLLGWLILFLSLTAKASDLEVISYSSEVKDGEEYFFLLGTSTGNYILRSWQFDPSKSWDGKSNIDLSVSQAIETAYRYFKKDKDKVGVQEVSLSPGFGQKNSVVWYYLVTLSDLPYKFGQPKYQIMVLTSGEIVEPKS